MVRRTLVLALLACAPLTLAAQGNPIEVPEGACTDAAPPQGFRASFSSSADNVRVLLCGGVKYLAETNRGGPIRLELRPLTAGVQQPQIREGMMGADVQGGRSWVIDVGTSGIFEIRVAGAGGGIPVDLTVTPRVDKSKEKAAKDQEKAAKKAAEEQEKAAKKAAEEQRKAEEKAAKEAEKARKEAEKQAKEAAEKP
jgi:hypothetical protein